MENHKNSRAHELLKYKFMFGFLTSISNTDISVKFVCTKFGFSVVIVTQTTVILPRRAFE